MLNIRRYIDGVSSLQFFQILRFGALILLGIILVKSGYNTTEVGIYELFFFLANVVSFFWSMGLKNALISYYPKLAENKKGQLLFGISVSLLLFSILAASLLYLFRIPLANVLSDGSPIHHLHLIMIYVVLNGPSNFIEYFYLLKKKFERIIQYAIIIFSLQLILIGIGVFMGKDIEFLLLLMVAWAGFKFLWFGVLVLENGHFKYNPGLVLPFLVFALPLMGHILLGNGMEFVDGFIVNYFFDESVFAQFRFGARELPLVTILAGAISTALIPMAVENQEAALEQTKNKINQLIIWLFPLSTVLMLSSPFLFPFFYSEEYIISARIFNIYLLIICSRLLMPQVILFARHENKFLLWSAAIELIINVGLSILFVKEFGILGIAWATVIAYLFNKLLLAWRSYTKYGVRIYQYINLKRYLFWTFILVISYFVSLLY